MYVGISETTAEGSVDGLTRNGSSLLKAVSVATSNYTITADYTNNTASSQNVFMYYLDRTAVIGEVYIDTFTAGVSPYTRTVTSIQHGLNNNNILYQLYKLEGSSWEQVKPDSFTLDPDNGEVSLDLIGGSIAGNYKLILSAVPVSQTSTSPNITGIANPYIFYTAYQLDEDTGLLHEIIPDSAEYDALEGSWELTYEYGASPTPGTVQVIYEYGTIRANEFCVDDASVLTSETDNTPQLSVYGFDHTTIYGEDKKVNRRGWVNHIDSYRSPTTTHMVAGLGGNLFSALSVADTYIPSLMAAAMPTYFPRLNGKVATETKIGPAFCDTGSSPERTRGWVKFDTGGTNWGIVQSVAYVGGNTVYTIDAPGLVVDSTPIDTNDYLTVKNMSSSRHSGTFKIITVSYGTSSIVITVDNPNIKNTDYNDPNTYGLAGVFTDRVTLAAPTPFIVGDQLLSSAWGDDIQLLVNGVDAPASAVVYIGQVYDALTLGANLALTGRRTSAVIPLRDINLTATSTNLVVGDTLSYTGFNRPLQIVAVDSTSKTITVDESFTWEDNISLPEAFSVARRWVPAEAPSSSTDGTLVPKTTIQHLSANAYDNQDFLRSAMVQNNMYLTNGSDEIYKYDGRNFYRAGIIPWQPGLFLAYETVPSGGIPLINVVADDGGGSKSIDLVGGRIKMDKTQAEYFDDGDTVVIEDGTVAGTPRYFLTIRGRELETAGNHYFFSFVETLPFTTLGSGATVKMILVYVARYYFRLNIRDVNGVVTSSAVTGAEDFVARITPITVEGQKVHLRLLGLPAWDQYDYRNQNIELEIYRTFWTRTGSGEIPVFFRLPQTKACSFNVADGYVDIVDTYSNDTLGGSDLVVGVLSPNVIPAAWDEPPRARYTTTAGNRLVLGNLTNWPTLAISYLSNQSYLNTDFNEQKLTFYKDVSATPLAATDMVNQVTYELTSAAGTALATGVFASVAGGFSFQYTPGAARVPAIGDWVYISLAAATSHPLDFCGWWQLSNVTGTGTFTCSVRSAKTYVAPTHAHRAHFATASKDVPVNINTDYNLNMVNGQVTNFGAASIRIIRRIGAAINATMRMVDTTIVTGTAHPYREFRPWLVARSESDTYGQLVVKQPRAEIAVPAVKITSLAKLDTYVNNSVVTATTITSAAITKYPSRIAVSYDNYPEIFDNLWTINPDESDSIIDINSSDGQEITGIIPFFGESAFGAALQSGVLVVFKQNSIYLVDLGAKAAGQNAVQRLETQGLGCTAPYSIAPTKDGIAFANDSGIYVLRRNQRIEYLGRFMERNWQEKVDRSFLDIVQGHHYGVGRQYKLSVPMVEDSTSSYAENSQVYVYNHTGEADGETGGWARYTNHPATGWANLFQDAFYANVNGSVLRLRNLGEQTDYRDGPSAVESILETRATSFGNTGLRKIVSNCIIHYRSAENSAGTKVYFSPDLFEEYDESTNFKVKTNPVGDGLSTAQAQAVVSVMHSLVRRRCIYMSVKIINNTKDENVEVAGMSFVVGGLSSSGIKQAAETE